MLRDLVGTGNTQGRSWGTPKTFKYCTKMSGQAKYWAAFSEISKMQRLNSKKEQPLDGDIERLSEGLQNEIKAWTYAFCEKPGTHERSLMMPFWHSLFSLQEREVGRWAKCWFKIILMLRSAAKIMTKTSEAFQRLSEFEQNIAKNHLFVKLIGQKDQHTPLLLPSFFIKSMGHAGGVWEQRKNGHSRCEQVLVSSAIGWSVRGVLFNSLCFCQWSKV